VLPHLPNHREVIMKRIRHLAYVLGCLAAGVLVLGSAPAFAERVPPPGSWGDPPVAPQHLAQMHPAATGGMPGWQIILIAAAAALVAATLAVIVDRARAARHHAPASTA
jgi:hypothetical protein